MERGARSLLPKEHGAWAMLLVPPLVAGALRGFTPTLALVIAVSLAFFTGHPSAQVLLRHASGRREPAALVDAARRRGAVCAAAAVAAGLPLLAAGHWHLLAFLPPAAAAFIGSHALSRAGGKTLLSDFTATAGLTLSGPAALAAAEGALSPACLQFYGYNLIFFGGTVFYVYMKLRRPGGGARPRVTAGRDNLLFQAGTLAGVGGLVLAGAAPAVALIPFLPMTAQAMGGTYTLGREVRFKRLGFLLLGHSILFGVLLGASLS